MSTAEFFEAAKKVDELINAIHRDGGVRLQRVGPDAALDEAIELVRLSQARNLDQTIQIEQLRSQLKTLQEKQDAAKQSSNHGHLGAC